MNADKKPLTFRVEATVRMDAPAPVVYRLIADYNTGHPRIVPPKYFSNLRVVKGGYGAGTEITFDVRALGRTVSNRARITEPEPGRVLVETDTAGRAQTTFTVVPDGADGAKVTISTRMPARRGLLGALERKISGWFLRKVYAAELALMNEVARSELTK